MHLEISMYIYLRNISQDTSKTYISVHCMCTDFTTAHSKEIPTSEAASFSN